MASAFTSESFLISAKNFIKISNLIHDDWKLHENMDISKTFIQKNTFVHFKDNFYKTEFVIFYNLSYGVPSFSFNVWDSTGSLLTLEEIRQMSFVEIDQKEFYSVITQQEHPILCRPYFIIHPCHTEALLSGFKESKNIIVTFLGLITPLINIKLPMQYGL